MSPHTTLTPHQQAALAEARRVLAAEPADTTPGADLVWRNNFRAALNEVTDAFPEDGAS